MAALTDAEYKKFHALADSIGLDVLVETHNEEEVKRKHSDFEYLRGLKFDAALIGEAFMREKDIKKAVDNLRYGN